MNSFLQLFTGFYNRYYKSSYGRQSSEWLARYLENAVDLADTEMAELVSVEPFPHPWEQDSIIVRISPKDSTPGSPTTILSAHQDSINQRNPYEGRAPGADDNGSGCAILYEAFRLLVNSDVSLKTPLEFHFYSGEEGRPRY